MTKHFKLENGNIIRFDNDGGNETVVDSVNGSIIGIIRGDERTGFIFRDGDDLNRLYLDNDGKPMTRLLMLLVSKLERLIDGVVTVTSVTRPGAGRRASRLHLDFSEGCDCGVAPYYLPEDAHLRNSERIALVLSSLNVMEDPSDNAPAVPSSESEEPGESVPTTTPETVTVEGTAQDSAGSGRRVSLVRSLTVLALFYHHDVDVTSRDRDGDEDFVLDVITGAGENLFHVETVSVSSSTGAKMLMKGMRVAVSACGGFLDHVAFITDQDAVRRLLRARAVRRGL